LPIPPVGILREGIEDTGGESAPIIQPIPTFNPANPSTPTATFSKATSLRNLATTTAAASKRLVEDTPMEVGWLSIGKTLWRFAEKCFFTVKNFFFHWQSLVPSFTFYQ
jgi:hypothetical protein